MREYKISKTDLGWMIYRVKKVGKLIMLEYLNGNLTRSLWRDGAKTFYDKESALSALVVIKRKWQKIDTTSSQNINSGNTREKQSWSEL